MCQIIPFHRGDLLIQELPFSFGEESRNRFFPGMAEGGIAQIVCKTSGGYDRTYFRQERIVQFRLAGKYCFGYIITQRTANARNLQTVR